MQLSDTFYVALCMTVLILGVVYWFWTQNQYMQRKMNLLENIVFEMKTQLGHLASAPDSYNQPMTGFGGAGAENNDSVPAYAPAPESVASEEDLHQELHEQVNDMDNNDDVEIISSGPLEPIPMDTTVSDVPAPMPADDLQPGGVGSGVEQTSPASSSNALDGMTLKELRRLGEQRGISGAAHLRKQALIDALRNAATVNPLADATDVFPPTSSTIDLS
jgi:hypothetical protein